MFIMNDIDIIREVLTQPTILLEQRVDAGCMFDRVDAFEMLSRGNKTVQNVVLCPYNHTNDDSEEHRYDIWEKIGQGIGNLEALSDITIEFVNDPLAPDFETLACILRGLSRGIHF
jgi:hypothetical protein